MADLALFTTPKPFRGLTATHQRNALESWRRLSPTTDVLVLGDEEGAAEAAADLRIRHIPGVRRNVYGMPFISSLFETAREATDAPLLCYANADIVFMSDFWRALQRVPFERFLMCGQRWDVDVTGALGFDAPSWEDDLRAHVAVHGRQHAVTGMDYFLFRRDALSGLPDFTVGRAYWDGWLLFHAREQRMPVVDATQAVMAVHQNHDYSHVSGGQRTVWEGPEARRNEVLAEAMVYPFTIADATWQHTGDGVRPRSEPRQRLRQALGEAAIAVGRYSVPRRLVKAAAVATRPLRIRNASASA